MRSPHPELGFYVLGGQPDDARVGLTKVRRAEALGLGTAVISERYNLKEVAALSGATGAVTDSIRIHVAATNHNTRHPMVTAGMARTLQSITDGRFVLGLARGVKLMQDVYGMPHITTAQMEDFVGPCGDCSEARRSSVTTARWVVAGTPTRHHARPVSANELGGIRPELTQARRTLL